MFISGSACCVTYTCVCASCSITGSHDKSIRVWSTTTWECTTVIGNAHASQSAHRVHIIQLLWILYHVGPVTCVTLNASVIASGAADKYVYSCI